MRAGQLISGANFGPEALKAITKAFDDAWAEIGPTVSKRQEAIEAARLSLANIVLSLAAEDTRDPEPIRSEAVRVFRLKRSISN